MYLAVPLVFFFVLLWAFLLLISGGKLILSKDKLPLNTEHLRSPRPTTMVRSAIKKTIRNAAKESAEEKKNQTAFIDLNGRLLPLDTSEVTQAKKDGFKIVYR